MVGICHLTDSHHCHHWQKHTRVGICHGGNMLGNHHHHLPSSSSLSSSTPGDESRERCQGMLRSSSPALGGRAAGGGEHEEGEDLLCWFDHFVNLYFVLLSLIWPQFFFVILASPILNFQSRRLPSYLLRSASSSWGEPPRRWSPAGPSMSCPPGSGSSSSSSSSSLS